MSKLLSALLSNIKILASRGMESEPACQIDGLSYDSREIRPGYLFFAFPGYHTDGHNFIRAAIQRGASAVIYDHEITEYSPGVVYIKVSDARLAMSPVAAAFYGEPSRSLAVIGVTGTEGKSTTVFLIYQLLTLLGKKAGFFSTVMADLGDGQKPNPEHQTTPEATTVQAQLAAMRDSGLEYAVVEASSHGLSARTGRLADVLFDIGVMTNVRHEHLEFHGTWEQYRFDKANLFRKLDQHDHRKNIRGRQVVIPSAGVVNEDDPSAEYFRNATQKPVIGFKVISNANMTASKETSEVVIAATNVDMPAISDLRAFDIMSDAIGSSFKIEGPATLEDLEFTIKNAQDTAHDLSHAQMGKGATTSTVIVPARMNLPGEYNVGNCLAAIEAVALATGVAWQNIVPALQQLKPVKGRMTRIDFGQPFELIIDYAHTPSSFQAILPPLRQRIQGKIICLFGSAGERDTEKRPQQARIAAQFCDILILADEDPRGEDPMQLLEEIAAGCPNLRRGEQLFLIPDRPTAIRKAFSLAAKDDLVLLLGKGHENSIIYKDHVMPYDEETEAIKALAELGYTKRSSTQAV